MTGEEIREKIIANDKKIEESCTLPLFILNKTVNELIEENKHLREICPHEFDEMGFCIYCDKRRV